METAKTARGKLRKLVTGAGRSGQERQLTIVLIGLCFILSILSPQFLSLVNLQTLLVQSAVIGIVAIGQTCVLLTGGIDLSLGTVTAMCGVVGALAVKAWGIPLGIAGFLVSGLLVGFFNGISVAYFRMAPFIVTLASMSLAKGVAFYITQASTVAGLPERFLFVGEGLILGVPVPVIVFAAMALIMGLLLGKTVYGRCVYAVGESEKTARISGINPELIKASVYVLSGLMAGLGGWVLTSRLASAAPGMGDTLVLDTVGAAVVGGTSLFGGKGTVWGTVLGVLLIGVLANGMNLFGMSAFVQMLIKGLVIFFVVLLDTVRIRYQGR